ncbi:MAG: Clp protease N-terminal domain-containing protein [Collinsella sp.]
MARENNQTYVSTEHLLIGIVEEGNGMAMDILMRLGVSSASIKKAIEKLTAKDQDKKRPLAGAGAGRPGAGLPFFSGSDASQQKGAAPIRLSSSPPTLRRRRATASSTRDWPRKGSPAHDGDPFAPHQEQPTYPG